MKTDSELQTDVLAELRWDSSINAAEIGVEAKNGVVTLTGEVLVFPKSGMLSELPSALQASAR
jgi:BON domain